MKDSFETVCGITDEQVNELARGELAKLSGPIKANKGKAIVFFVPFRKEGVVETPWDFNPNSVEAVIVDDNTGYELPRGLKVMAHPEKGNYFEHQGVRLCVVEADDLLLVEEA